MLVFSLKITLNRHSCEGERDRSGHAHHHDHDHESTEDSDYDCDLNNASLLDAILFADDTHLFTFHNDPVYLINTLNRKLNKLSTWFAANRLSLKLAKTNFMAFKPWQKKQSFEFQVFINEQPILRVSETMFLDVLLHDNVT